MPEKHNLQEMPTSSYTKRTEQKVFDSDGTLILSHGELTGGSRLTKEFAENQKKPCLHIDLNNEVIYGAAVHIVDWIQKHATAVNSIQRKWKSEYFTQKMVGAMA